MKFLIAIFAVILSVNGLGNWHEVSVDDERVLQAAHYASKSLSDRMNSAYHGKLAHLHHAELQIVAGVNYRIEITLATTNCKKTEVSYEQIENCEFQEGLAQRCKAVVYKNLKGDFKVREFQCTPESELKHAVNPVHVNRIMFQDFIAQYKKGYKDEAEKEERFQIFQRNLNKIKILNDHERGTARYGITEFTDLTEEEFRKTKLGFRPDLLQEDDPLPKATIPYAPLPGSFDWRDSKVVTEVKNQGQCGSCWAFSTTGNIEGMWALKKKSLVSLSEQELVDCDKVDQGCEGGLPSNAYKEIIRLGGLEGEKDYPYDGSDDKCQFTKKEVKVYINSSVAISSNETEMAMWLVQNGPISIGINANAMQFYYGGVSHPWKFLCSPKSIDHGVLIVGFGVHTYPLFNTTLPFWIIKNSWGATWGEQGYYRVYRGDGTCGLNTMATSSIIN